MGTKVTKKEAERIAYAFAAWSLRRALGGGVLDRFIAEAEYPFAERIKVENAAALLEDAFWHLAGYTLPFPRVAGKAIVEDGNAIAGEERSEKAAENYEARRKRSEQCRVFDRAKREADADADALRAACAPRVAAVRRAITSPPAENGEKGN